MTDAEIMMMRILLLKEAAEIYRDWLGLQPKPVSFRYTDALRHFANADPEAAEALAKILPLARRIMYG